MNYRVIGNFLGNVLKIEALLLLLPFITGIIYKEEESVYYLITAFLTLGIGLFLSRKKNRGISVYYSKEGFVSVGLAWIVMGILGALPFVMSGEIPRYIDALFETISGFTTTGASILPAPEEMSHATNLWRCTTHWIGGMGIIVFMLAVFPSNGNSMRLMRAESPGPQVGKLVPKIKDTAKTLYLIYIFLTLAEMIVLCLAGMPLYDSVCAAFGSAGTGGFGIKNDSMAGYSTLIQVVITVFILLFGVNFNAYYYLIRSKDRKNAFRIEEVKWYFIIVIVSIFIVTMNVRDLFPDFGTSFQQSAFQVASIITTTGYATTDFNIWPSLSKAILVLLMFVGACAGSTGGGIKVSRIVIEAKLVKEEIRRFIHPKEVRRIRLDGKSLDEQTIQSVASYILVFMLVFIVSVIMVSINDHDLVSSFTSVAATLNNIGPGLNLVGPTGNYSMFSDFSKFVLMFDMLAGRLELYPILLLLAPDTYRKI